MSDLSSFNSRDRSRVDFLKKLGTWTFTSAEELERSENRIRNFAACKTTQEFVTTRLHNPGVEDVEISINTVKCGEYSKDKPTLVIAHGFANAWGSFICCLGPLSAQFNVVAIDWVGNGRSSRPPYKCKNCKEAQTHHVEALEAWRKAKGLEQMVLLGHSFGGYMSACYAHKYPERVSHLVLASPAGVPIKPQDADDRIQARMKTMPLGVRAAFYSMITFWTWGWTPQSVVRSFGPFGEKLVRAFVNNKIKPSSSDEDSFDVGEFQAAFADYMYHSLAGKGSSEFSLLHVLQPGAYSYDPLCLRLSDMAVPVSFIYGDRDWMNSTHASDLVKSSPRGPISKAEVVEIPGAGHQLMLDQPKLFAEAVCRLVRASPTPPST